MWFPTILFALFLGTCHSAKILGVFPVSAKSHYILGSALMRGLAERGHDVTVISPYFEKNPPKNGSYRDIVLKGVAEDHDNKIKLMNPFNKDTSKSPGKIFAMVDIMTSMTESVFNSSEVQKLIASDEKFDVVVIEEFMNAALKVLPSHFNAHLVLLSTMGANAWVNNLVGNPTPLAYVPDLLLGYSSDMNFKQRVINTLVYVAKDTVTKILMLPKQKALIEKYMPNGPKLDDVLYNASLVLVNSHTSTNQPVPYVPQMVDIGGYHVHPPKKLPKDLQEYLDNSKEGVIYFSLGSNMKSAFLPEDKRQALLNTFAKLDMKVIWKWEEPDLPGKPPNVMISKWLPQQDILAHPNVKLFITHAGLLSTIETIYHGVPVLALPIGGDQLLNAQQIVNEGFGLSISIHELTEKALTESLTQLLSNSKYRENAKMRSQVFHDRLVDPMETATYWIEYVIRNNGTSHLRVAALDLPFYKYFLLDVISFIAIMAYILIKISCKLLKLVCRKKKVIKNKKE